MRRRRFLQLAGVVPGLAAAPAASRLKRKDCFFGIHFDLHPNGNDKALGRDVTPEAIAPLVSKDIAGFGELFRWLSYEQIGAATIQSRAFAALCGNTLVFALPGSTGAVHLALDRIIVPQLDNRTRPCNFAMLLPRLSE